MSAWEVEVKLKDPRPVGILGQVATELRYLIEADHIEDAIKIARTQMHATGLAGERVVYAVELQRPEHFAAALEARNAG